MRITLLVDIIDGVVIESPFTINENTLPPEVMVGKHRLIFYCSTDVKRWPADRFGPAEVNLDWELECTTLDGKKVVLEYDFNCEIENHLWKILAGLLNSKPYTNGD